LYDINKHAQNQRFHEYETETGSIVLVGLNAQIQYLSSDRRPVAALHWATFTSLTANPRPRRCQQLSGTLWSSNTRYTIINIIRGVTYLPLLKPVADIVPTSRGKTFMFVRFVLY